LEEITMSRIRFARSLLATSILTGNCLLGLSPAYAYDEISGPSPFDSCNTAGEPGILYPDAEVEPWVDVNRANPNNMIAGWQQDRWSNGGARSLMSAYSADGGATWTRVIVPGINKCSNGGPEFAYDRSTDPWVTFSPDGSAYFMTLSFNNDLPTGSVGANSMMVSKSTDGGATWSLPTKVSDNNDGQSFDDKNSITADPIRNGYVYAVWDRLIDFSVPPLGSGKDGGASSGAPYHGDGVAAARQRLRTARTLGPINNSTIWTGPTYMARTTDGGATWETKKIFDTGNNDQTIGNIVEVLPNSGTVIDFFTHLSTLGWGGVKLGLIKSHDAGATFGPASYVSQMVVTTTGTLTPDSKQPVRDGNILFDSAVDRQSGNLYVVWQDSRNRNIDQVFFSMSTNAGNSWSTPVKISKTPYNPVKLRNQSFVPSVAVGANHKVYVTYYDFRNDTSQGGELTDYWAISCDIAVGANCRTAGGWGNEVRLTPTSFNMLDAPVARGHFLGDYMGLAQQGSQMRAVFGVAVAPNENQIVTATIP
jgi:hypothetical protein